VDVIGYHLYVAPQAPEATLPLASSIKRVMFDAGIPDKPLWNTETGWFLPKPFPPELAAGYVVREYLVNWAAGIQRLYWYAWDNHGWVTLETTESDNRTLTSAGLAYSVSFRWLAGSRMLSCAADSQQTWICELERDHRRQRILWNARGAVAFHLPLEWHAQSRELVSGEHERLPNSTLEIGPTPVLVLSTNP